MKLYEEEVDLKKIKQKDLYRICLYPVQPPSCLLKWREIFQWEEMTLEDLFKEKRHFMYNRKSYDFHWKVLHREIFCETKLKKMKKSNGICKLCNQYEEDIAHLIQLCPVIENVWAMIETYLMNTVALDIRLNTRRIILGVTTNECNESVNIKIFINFIILMTKWSIWKHRNDIKYGKQQTKNSDNIYSIIMKMCQKEIKAVSESFNYAKCKQELKIYMLDLLEENF